MKKISKYYRRLRIENIKVMLLLVIASIFFLPNYVKMEQEGDNIFTVLINGEQIGMAASRQEADECLTRARREIAAASNEMVLIDQDLQIEGSEVLIGRVDSRRQLTEKMKTALLASKRNNVHHAYTVKINEYTVNLATVDEVNQLLQAALDRYEDERKYIVSLQKDTAREFNVLTPVVESVDNRTGQEDGEAFPEAGILEAMDAMFDAVEPAVEKEFSDYELGLTNMAFKEKVEIVENTLSDDRLTDVVSAIEEVTKDQEVPSIYEVVSGDTLSGIAMANNLTIEDLVAMNSALENENSMIRIGDELTITVPEPELSVLHEEQQYYEEDYEAEIQYVDNDEWYTNQTQTLQEPSAGHRKVVAVISYQNNAEVGREILKEDVSMEAVPKIVERGTKIPPTYIRPLSGGRMTSTFGRRRAPTRGASSYHRGIDWGVPVGTAVMASCGGTVVRAGWASGLGNSVTISNPDGRQTIYGHLSRVLVSSGQTVNQGQKIALSGNTGISTGPHLHFAMTINGTYVNPLNYLQ
ncbi:MAG: M23 family metallopeptidase [Lachnospiraceae bacterium]|nr:M23 family metallopeptidase [Lachnospiraceae bacterium]